MGTPTPAIPTGKRLTLQLLLLGKNSLSTEGRINICKVQGENRAEVFICLIHLDNLNNLGGTNDGLNRPTKHSKHWTFTHKHTSGWAAHVCLHFDFVVALVGPTFSTFLLPGPICSQLWKPLFIIPKIPRSLCARRPHGCGTNMWQTTLRQL